MPRRGDAVPYDCFAPQGEPHGNYQNEPFSNDAVHRKSEQGKIWIGYRNALNASYNGGMTFGQVLAQARSNLSEAMKARPNSTQRAQWREAFPGFATKATAEVVKQLQQGKRAFRQATCPSDMCKSGSEELLQMEWISIKSSVTKTEVFLIGYVFQLQGHEMIAICRNYSSSLYRFQRTDGSVSPDMFIRTVQSEPSSPAKAEDKPNPHTSSRKNLKRRRSGRHHVPDALEDEDLDEGTPLEPSSATTLHATDDSTAQSSPGMSIGEPTQGLEDETIDKGEGITPALNNVVTLSPTADEYTGMIYDICHTYGVRVLRRPDITSHIDTLEQVVRENNLLALCRSFAKIKTILVVTAADVGSDFLDEEYETMVSSTVAEFGIDLLTSTEGVLFMKNMGDAMVAGQREYLSAAYANLRAYMVAYTGRG